MANSTVAVSTPKSKTIEAASAAALDTAVAAQVNTLVQQYVNPKNTGAAAGTVQNGTIVISETLVINTSSNVSTYRATVLWTQWVIPT